MSDDIQQNTTDYVVTTAKAVLGMIPFAGSLLAELAGTIVPKQRIDRLASFATKLEHKVGELDKESVRAKLTDENFTDLLEETARHAVRAVTDDRREYLSSLLAAGISEERVSFVESKHLLRILSEINDIEIVWLRYHLFPYMSGDEAFRTKHARILEPVATHLGSDQATLDCHALQENYLQHLVSLGLLDRPFDLDRKTGYPAFDKLSNNWKTLGHHVTPLGRLLLKHIGLGLSDEPEGAEQ